MGRVQRIIEWATREARSKPECALSEKVYRDEPILMTASQMRSFLPCEYREMRAIAMSSEARFKPSSWVFARQAKFMESFEDDYPYSGEFVRYYPTYMAMSEDQLRGYFTWRARLRRGEMPEGPTSFAFVYVYELLNGAGAKTPERGFRALRSFYEDYGAHDSTVRRYLKRWLVDYVAWHGLDSALLNGLMEGGAEESIAAIEAASDMDASRMEFACEPEACVSFGASDSEGVETREEGAGDSGSGDTSWDSLFCALARLSTYRIKSSRLFKEHPHEFRRALCGACVELARYCAVHRKTSFSQGLFGTFREEDYVMFQNAVFYDDGRHPDAIYQLPDGRTFTCRGGRWRLRKRVAANRGPKLGSIVKAVDAGLRDRMDMGSPLKSPELPKYMGRIIADRVREAVEWEREHAPFELNLDVAQLSGIRSAAAQTCEALLVDEERETGRLERDARNTESGSESMGEMHAHPDGRERRATDDGAGEALADGRRAQPSHGPQSGDSPGRFAKGVAEEELRPTAYAANDSAASIADAPLDANERRWLVALLDGDAPAARESISASGLTEDMMADAVNERLFDYLGDTAVEYADDGYAVVEDYREDVEGMVR